ncbi:MAG: 50S ribosome-binding GTPase [Candidatus Nanoarchaeia archaeon]|nr:50S ribosome-binding GTPase [Candidatus Nanoarchaeia archaeon]MDD5740759.1 50S ribosome-binding GTPase [Candidatus Nanoarchaeia archaeon]
MELYWDSIKRIITESDIVLEILDARLVELSRNEEVEELIKKIKRPVIFVINKSDLTSKESIREPIEKLSQEGEVVFVSSENKHSARILTSKIKQVFEKYGKRDWRDKVTKPTSEYREAKGEIIVGVLGYPNVGKSSIINMLAHRKKVKVSKKAGTTHGIHWIRASNEIKLIDTPGVIPLKADDDIRYGLIGARDIEKLKDAETVADSIIKLFMKNNKKAFEDFYGIGIEAEDYDSIINQLGLKKSFLIKGNRVDENRTAVLIVKDWQQGRLRLYT